MLREPYAETSLAMHFTHRDEDGRLYRERVIGGKAYRYYADEGRRLGSVWTDIPAMVANTPLRREATGYPTQKPERLLERIVRASSRAGRDRRRSRCAAAAPRSSSPRGSAAASSAATGARSRSRRRGSGSTARGSRYTALRGPGRAERAGASLAGPWLSSPRVERGTLGCAYSSSHPGSDELVDRPRALADDLHVALAEVDDGRRHGPAGAGVEDQLEPREALVDLPRIDHRILAGRRGGRADERPPELAHERERDRVVRARGCRPSSA